jgi:hypothetical protein
MNNTNETVNNFVGLEEAPSRIISYLLSNNTKECEDLWKVLYYPTIDALQKDNLTLKQKRDAIWKGQPNEVDYKIFNKPVISDAMVTGEDMIQLRVFRYGSNPTDTTEAIILFEFEIYSNDKTSNIINENDVLVERTDFIENHLLSLLNGTDIGLGYGYLVFNRQLSTYSKSTMSINNSKSYYGRSFMMALQYMNIPKVTTCEEF